jgi:hypothetical protein
MRANTCGDFLALWNGIDPERDAEYNEWHAREHVPERLRVPGMLFARRYGARDDAAYPYFTLYDLASLDVLATPAYEALLSNPTPWSRSMRPSFRQLLRLPCQGMAAAGSGWGGALTTVVFPAPPTLHAAQSQASITALAALDGVVSVRLGLQQSRAAALPWRTDSAAAVNSNAPRGVLLLEAQEPLHLERAQDQVLQHVGRLAGHSSASVPGLEHRCYALLSAHLPEHEPR